MKKINLEGKKFNRLTVLKEAGRNKSNHLSWLCLCECGNEKVVTGSNLKTGRTQSCGCFKDEMFEKRNTTHGMKDTKLYKVWQSIKGRTLRSNDPGYKNYGGRGIAICDEWVNDFATFHKWAMSNGYREGLSIDRIDNDGNYSPDNCRWTTRTVQSRNTRRKSLISWRGSTKLIAEWAEDIGLPYHTLNARLKVYKWPIEKALTTPVPKMVTVCCGADLDCSGGGYIGEDIVPVSCSCSKCWATDPKMRQKGRGKLQKVPF